MQIVQSNDFTNMIEMWGGYHTDSITDSELLTYIGISISKESHLVIPKWFKINFVEWVLDNDVNEEDMKEALTWINKNWQV